MLSSVLCISQALTKKIEAAAAAEAANAKETISATAAPTTDLTPKESKSTEPLATPLLKSKDKDVDTTVAEV